MGDDIVRQVEAAGLPHPFYADGWSKALKPAAQALWHWHLGLDPVAAREEEAAPFFEEEYARAVAGRPLRLLPEAVTGAAYAACRTHQLPMTLLAEQVQAAARLRAAVHFDSYAALQAFIEQRAGAHARLLARLAHLKGSWQIRHVDELARAFFLVSRLAALSEDLARDRLYIPLDEMEQAGVSLDRLRRGAVNEDVRKLCWKQAVRARDAFAQGQPLVKDLAGRQARAFKRWWLGGLEVLNEIERRGYDLWSRPVALSPFQQFHVRFQALVGRTSFR